MPLALDLSAGPAGDVAEYVARTTGQDLRACYQCGKCAAGCPVAAAMDLAPQQVIRALQLNQPDVALESDTVWLCVGCQTCVTRCPCNIDLPKVMDALRAYSVATGRVAAERDVARFHAVFLKSVELTGRVYEIGLIGGYNLTSGHLFSSVDLAGPMLAKGKIKPMPQRVKAMDEVAGIFRRAAAARAEDARPTSQPTEGAQS
jgi:heterodisulfide reductase subunit C2